MPSKARTSAAPPSEEAIRQQAYLLWEADGRPDGMADHYWARASEAASGPAPDRGVLGKAKAIAARTAAALKAAKPKGKAVNPAETAPVKAKVPAKSKAKAAASKVTAPAVKAKPAAKAPTKKPKA